MWTTCHLFLPFPYCPPHISPFWWASQHQYPLEKCILNFFFFLGWTEHLRSGNKQQIQSRQTEEIGEEVQDLVDQTKLWTVETWEYLFQMIFFDWLVSNSANWFMVSVQPSSYTGCGRLLSSRDALELHKAIASRLLKSILSENEGKGLP